MKIAIDLTALAFNFSGVERYALNISKTMIENNNEDMFYLLFCNEIHKEYHEICQKENVKYFIVKAQKSKMSKLYMFQVKNLVALKKMKADRYVFLAFAPPVFFHESNMITTIHDLGYFDCPKMWKWYVTLYGKCKICAAIRHSKKIVTVSEYTRKRLIDMFKYNKGQINVIYNAVDKRFNDQKIEKDVKEALTSKYKLPENSFLLCLATLEPRKNLKLLIEAYAQLKERGLMEKDLVLAGRSGWKFNDLFYNYGNEIANAIHFTGFIEDKDLPMVYKMADYFVFPSKYEGFGIPPLEAMACGTQPLVSDLEVFKEVLGDAAVYFKNNNLTDLENVLVKMEKRPKELLYRQAQKYSWDKSAELLYGVIK